MDTIMKTWLKDSLHELFNSNDNSLIERKLKEECINHRLAYYLEKYRPYQYRMYYIDIEYNKNGINEKTLEIDGQIKPIRPDILIHRRTDDIMDNLLAIECKIGYLNKKDKIKLMGLLGKGFLYSEAIGLSYQSNRDFFLLYENHSNCFAPRRIKKTCCSLQ